MRIRIDVNGETIGSILKQLKELEVDPNDAEVEVDSYVHYNSLGMSSTYVDAYINVPEAKYPHLKGK